MIKNISDTKHYRITLNKRAEVEGITLYPGREYTVIGSVLKAIKSSVEDAKAI